MGPTRESYALIPPSLKKYPFCRGKRNREAEEERIRRVEATLGATVRV